MGNSPKMKAAIDKVMKELEAMSPEEFQAKIDARPPVSSEHASSDYEQRRDMAKLLQERTLCLDLALAERDRYRAALEEIASVRCAWQLSQEIARRALFTKAPTEEKT